MTGAGARSLADLSAVALLDGFRRRAFTPSEALDAMLRRLDEREPEVHAMVATRLDAARDEARAAAAAYRPGAAARPLEGVPFVAKDVLDTADLPTAGGAPWRANHRPAADAEAVRRLRAAGAILVGKTATHQFALGITTVASGPGRASTRNPADPSVVAGGSSGGSAAALAIGAAPLALGTDTAGSIRIPADFCGVAGLRPTFGAVPVDGVLPLAPSLDVVGPMARTIEDLALAQAVLTGDPPPRRDGEPTVRGLRIGIAEQLGAAWATAERRRALRDAAERLAGAGAAIVPLDLPATAGAYDTLGEIVSWEVLPVHRRLGLAPPPGHELDPDVARRLARAANTTEADYGRAQARQEEIAGELRGALRSVDVLLSLSAGSGPVAIEDGGGSDEFRRRVMTCTSPQSIAGLPALALPVGTDARGHPYGVQLTGPPRSEKSLLQTGDAIGRCPTRSSATER
ncbi:MAG TPA: amidase [Solirubrobacteraceae bacterium]|jgi:aspartyl-tRNA(Asn)/glutamyl-tRNA(Gln) amidotransferase subunit A|nr:amidase [Solirubrobacteraceae bacterium]